MVSPTLSRQRLSRVENFDETLRDLVRLSNEHRPGGSSINSHCIVPPGPPHRAIGLVVKTGRSSDLNAIPIIEAPNAVPPSRLRYRRHRRST